MSCPSNTGPASRTVRENSMKHFDQFPPPVRAAIANARFDWAIAAWLKAFKRGEVRTGDLVTHIQRSDKVETAKTRFKAWGGDYPILPGEITHIPLTKKARRQ
jgi:putative intracellular protease/amidase